MLLHTKRIARRFARFSCTAQFIMFVLALSDCASLPAQQVGSLTGVVLDSGGQPLAAAKLVLSGPLGEQQTMTGSDGRFRFSGVLANEYSLNISRQNFESRLAKCRVEPGGDTKLELRLKLANVRTEVTVADSADIIPQITSTATRTPTALLDVPQSIQIVDQQLLVQQQAITMADIVRNVSGVSVPNSSGGRAEDINMRGFTTGAVFKDGFRFDGFANRAPLEVANIEQVEVLKGPSSALFGRLDPAGVVNLVTKQPLSKHYLSLQLQRGGWRNWRPSLDVSGPMNRSGSLLYRFNALYQNADSFRDFLYHRKVFVSPALTWNASDRTTIKFYADYLGGESVIDRGLVAIGNRPAPLPSSRYLGNPFVPYPYRQGRTGLNLEHYFGPAWSFRSSQRSNVAYAGYNGWQPTGLLANVENRTQLQLSEGYNDQNLQQHYWQNDLIGHVNTGTIQHTLLAGLDLNRESFSTQSYGRSQRTFIDIYQPVYSFPGRSNGLANDTRSLNQYGGVFVQDQITLFPKLKVLVGGRYDIAQLTTDNVLRNTRTNTRATAFTPRTGIVFNPTSFSSVYFNYSRSFFPQTGTTITGQAFDPERGEVYEAGVKLNLLQQKLTASASVFHIRKEGILTADPFNDGFSIQVGEQRNRGFEMDLLARPTRAWTVLFNYAHNNPRITRDNIYTPGNYLLSTPFNTGSVWTNYEIPSGRLRGLSFGGGLFAVGQRWGDLENSFVVPGFSRLDASVSYRLYRQDKQRYRFSLNVNNLLDRRYFEGVRGRAGIVPGAPRNVIATVQWFL